MLLKFRTPFSTLKAAGKLTHTLKIELHRMCDVILNRCKRIDYEPSHLMYILFDVGVFVMYGGI